MSWTVRPSHRTRIRDHPIPLRGVAAKGKGAQLTFMLDRAGAVVAALERYFGRPYPFDKLDVIAAVDFSAGAMENAGAITYREQSILVGDDAPLSQKRNVLVTLAHELSHQWFGDLVTPAWWDDIWLNKSFATWMSYRTLNELYPGDHYDRDIQRYAQRAFGSDQLTTARQIRQPVTDANGIVTAFDGITYAKGGAVLRMMENYLGARPFRAGIRAYLNKFAFGTATADDLIQSIAEATSVRRVKPAFNSFLEQAGLPELDVKLDCDKFGGGRIALEQSRYLPLGSKGSTNRRWTLPVCLSLRREDNATRQCLMMTKRRTTIDIPAGQCPAAVMPNAMGAGYYRWQLDEKSWDALLADLPQLPAQEQLTVADSLNAAFNAGRISKADYISRAALLAKSDNWDVMSAPMGMLDFIVRHLTPEDGKAALRQSLGGLYSGRLKDLGLDPTTELDRTDPISATQMRSSVVEFLATVAKDAALRAELAERAKAFLGMGGDGQLHRDAISPDLADVAFLVGAEDIGANFVDALLKHLVTSQDGNLRSEILSALGHTTARSKIAAVRALALSDTIRNNEVRMLISSEMYDEETAAPTWDWIREHYKALSARYAKWTEQDLITSEDHFCNPERRDEVDSFFKPRIADIEGGKRALDNTLEEIDLCIAMRRKYNGG